MKNNRTKHRNFRQHKNLVALAMRGSSIMLGVFKKEISIIFNDIEEE